MALTDKLTSIADAIRTKNGTSAKLSLDDMASSILAIESGSGIDTSDATATAENIESGYTAYVKGEQITGSLETGVQANLLANSTTYSNEGSVKYSTSTGTGDFNSPSCFTVSYENRSKRIAKVNDKISANVRASLFGNATVNDVVKGKTFSSKNGLKLTGTYEGSTGLDTSDATATAGDIVSGKTAYVNAEKITGNLSTLQVAPGTPEYNTSPDQIKISTSLTGERYIVENTVSLTAKASDFGDAVPSDVVSGKTFTSASGLKLTGTYEGSTPTLQEKTVTPSEESQLVTPDSDYDGLSQVTVNAISSTYIGSGVTKKSATTYTPGTSDQTIASGQYLNGTQIIKGDSNLVAGNIKSGVSIFGVSGSYAGSGGSSGGLVTKTGTTTSATIETSLSSISMFVIYTDSFSSTGFIQGTYVADDGIMHYTYCSSYSSYMKICGVTTSTSCTVDGGIFTLNTPSHGLISGKTYNWIAVGEA